MEKIRKLFLFIFILLFNFSNIFAQGGVAVNNTGVPPDHSAILDVSSNCKGLLIPRVILTSIYDTITIPNPALSLLVYNFGTVLFPAGFYYWNGSQWVIISNQNNISNTNPSTVTLFDDFVNGTWFDKGNNSGNFYEISGNFVSSNSSHIGSGVNSMFSETNHPGIARLNVSGNYIISFTRSNVDAIQNTIGLSFDNDFNIEISSRITYATSGAGDVLRAFYSLSSMMENTFPQIYLENNNGIKKVFYDKGSGSVDATPLTAFPNSNDWFKINFTKIGSTLIIKLNNDILYSGTTTSVGFFPVNINNYNVNSATLSLDIDYVLINYQVIR
jgi:hypothetical protein